MAVEYLFSGAPDGLVIGRSDDKISFFGVTTATTQPTAVTTVDTTTITAVQVATATTTHLIAAANSLITDSRAQAVAINAIITRLAALGLTA